MSSSAQNGGNDGNGCTGTNAGNSSPRLQGKLTHMKFHSGRLPGSSFGKSKLSASSRSSRAAALKLAAVGGKAGGVASNAFIKTRKAIRQVRQQAAAAVLGDSQLESTTESEETGMQNFLALPSQPARKYEN